MSWAADMPGAGLVLTLACALAVFVAGWFRERRVGQTAIWRRVALTTMTLALLALILRPTVERSVDPQTAWVLTPGATRQEALDSGLAEVGSALSVALPGAKPWSPLIEESPDLAGFLRRNPQVEHLQVLGAGLEPWALQGLGPTVEVSKSPKLRPGIAAISWSRQLQLGESLQVTGSLLGLGRAAATLSLQGPTGSAATIELTGDETAEWTPFNLEVTPPGKGRFLYRLLLVSDELALESVEIIEVQVRDTDPPAILWLEDAPSFETKFVKQWLIDQGSPLAIRSRISRDRFHYDFHRLEMPALGRMSWDLLESFDLVIAEQRVWEQLGDAEKGVLTQAVRETGLGVLVRLNPDRAEGASLEWPLGFSGNRIADLDRLMVQPSRRLDTQVTPVEVAPFELTLERATSPLFTDSADRILAMSRLLGRGNVGVTLLRQTYPWVLEGHPEAQHSYWRRLIDTLARHDTGPEWRLRPGPVLVDEPLELELNWEGEAGQYPEARLRSGEGLESRVAMRQDPTISSRWIARVWPAEVGWHRVTVAGAEFDFHVSRAAAWASWQDQRRHGATRRAALRVRQSEERRTVRLETAVPRLPFYAIVLGSLALLWLDERRGSRAITPPLR